MEIYNRFFIHSSCSSMASIDLTKSWWKACLCLTQPFRDLKHFSQSEHLNWGSFSWHSSCCLRSEVRANFLPHWEHSKGLSLLQVEPLMSVFFYQKIGNVLCLFVCSRVGSPCGPLRPTLVLLPEGHSRIGWIPLSHELPLCYRSILGA